MLGDNVGSKCLWFSFVWFLFASVLEKTPGMELFSRDDFRRNSVFESR